MMKTKKQEFYQNGNYVYYPVSHKEYNLDLILSMVWNIILGFGVFYLITNISAWWILLMIFVSNPNKIAKQEISSSFPSE